MRLFNAPEAGHARPPLWARTDSFPAPDSTTSATAAPFTPAQILNAYGFNKLNATGAGQTIAIVDAYDDSQYIQSDLNAFCSQFGLPATTVDIIYAQGSQPAANSGWQEEESLDVEWAHAIAPAAKIMLVEAAGSSTANLLAAVQAAVNNGATVVSMSWGANEFAAETADDSYFTAPGVTFVASAGDSGAGVEWPAASPNVLGVGGTTLTLNSNGAWASESAWTNGGGGISAYETTQPAWQNGWFESGWTPVYRGVPDVALIADPNTGVYVVYQGSLYVFGGTSVGAPQWSGLIALINQTKGSAVGNPAALLYSAANGGSKTSYGGNSISSNYFHDISSGNDGAAPDDYSYVGYDLVTGLGSPLANNVVSALAGKAPAPAPAFGLALSGSAQTVTAGNSASYVVTVSPSNGYTGTVELSVSGLPSGASASFSPASVTQSGSVTLHITTSSTTAAGAYNLTITGADSAGAATKAVVATLTVNSAATTVTVSSVSYTVSGAGYANLNVALSAVNNLNSPVAGAVVSITLYRNGVALGSGAAQTASNGQVTFTLGGAPAGNYSTVVNLVTASGLTWNGKYPVETVYDPY